MPASGLLPARWIRGHGLGNSEYMAYRLNSRETFAAAIKAAAQAEVTAAATASGELPEPEAVHELRKHCKKMRALLRLIRGGHEALYRRENAHYRTLARRLAANRDMVSVCDAYAAIATPQDFPRIHTFIAARCGRRDRAALAQAAESLRRGAGRIPDWPLVDLRWRQGKRGFFRAYGRARKLKARAIPRRAAGTLHEYRKRTKDHWYHCRLLQERYPSLADRCAPLEALSRMLGDWRDLHLLCELLAAEREIPPGELVALLEIAGQRGATLYRGIQRLSADLFPAGKAAPPLTRGHK
ncbi:CHAD domain-containing protein [Microbulbifer discodermiae]|uniref:CHAD domain-containing protein n=1 Tax=Microbulbifer sp. 2201CG32-9 TaxID=3232309 RepID=UPI00345C41D1